MTIDPRLAERRKVVAEDRAHRNIGRLLKFLIAVAVLAGLTWLAFSPWLSIDQVRTAGISTSDANRILADHSVVAGTPLVLLRARSVEEALLADPWIADARVYVEWPDEVVVRVVERVPVAWVETAGGWTRRAADGVSVPSKETPDESLPLVHLSHVAEDDAETSELVLGAVEFSESLPDHLLSSTSLRYETGELWATVGEHQVRLGRPVEMADKAFSLAAVLEETIPPDSEIVLIAPTHPAIAPGGATESGPGSDQ